MSDEPAPNPLAQMIVDEAKEDFFRLQQQVDRMSESLSVCRAQLEAYHARVNLTEMFLAEALDWGVGASNRFGYVEHGMLCESKSNGTEKNKPCDCGLDQWEKKVRAYFDDMKR